ncbi:cAMP-binding domain of CRP or a regulatory subunit of cAMP-dependent protein kinases [Mucilaginibacter pineti]|uniref:cAMP-binding domain of CRP or a regulatory subunit of cAMP-dependent protein kinases n=1 Tax=Mucilaginibacter pineti TaxID=1391627 RepID=A0A1G7C135_9SPHI|nr:Crp/Fnr family transcriptional regulator [Mucilaginibacter pineti]SDE33058.1 cAMP-binding domain of CRP or a regulatory subunit of cAMP-dependent protein kinases [Mucilaginibacter pineti]
MLNSDDISFYLTRFKGLSITDAIALFKLAQTKKLAAGDIYIHQNSNYQKVAFIKKGLIRMYQLKPSGDEVTLMLRWENKFIASHDSIILQQPSRFIYQALEDTVLMEIDYRKAQPLMENTPKLSALRNEFLLAMLAESMHRVESFIMLSPEERYLQLVREKPDIVNRVPDKYLATLLGITPVSLSRIRKRIATPAKR